MSSNRIVLRLYCSPEKEKEGVGGGWRQSATGNLKSCANTQQAREEGEERGGMVERERRWKKGGPARVGRGWKAVVRSRNYVVPCNSHPNDSWMIKAGHAVHAREVRIDSWSNRRGKILTRFVQNSYSFDRWRLELDASKHGYVDRIGRFREKNRGKESPSLPHGIKRLTPRCSSSRKRRNRYSFLLCEIIAEFMMIKYWSNDYYDIWICILIMNWMSDFVFIRVWRVIGNGWKINYILVCLTFKYI